MMEVMPKFCFQDGKPVDVSKISSFLLKDARFVLKQVRAALKQAKTTYANKCKQARKDRNELLVDEEVLAIRTKKSIREVCASIIKCVKAKRDSVVEYVTPIITDLKTRIASIRPVRRIVKKAEPAFAPIAQDLPKQKNTDKHYNCMFASLAHCCTRTSKYVEASCKEPEEWQHYLNKSECGQYWTGVTNHKIANYIMLDKNGDVMRDAKEFRPYYLIYAQYETVGVYCAQYAKYARNKTLRFDKQGVSDLQECQMYASYESLGSTETMADTINNNCNHSSNPIYVRQGEKKWLPALIRFSKQVYNY